MQKNGQTYADKIIFLAEEFVREIVSFAYAESSIDQVERITGFDFFPELPDKVETEVEKTYNLNHWK